MVVALAVALLLASSAATARNNYVVERKEIATLNKSSFLSSLSTEKTMLIGFLEKGQDESERMLYELEMFAGSAQGRYPDLKVIPELHLLVRDSNGGKWKSHSIDVDISVEGLSSYVDNQSWMLHAKDAHVLTFCTPFNFCGRMLGALAEKSIALERALPIPKWLAMILIPALITFAGRFVIESMYSTEERVRTALSGSDNGAQSLNDSAEQNADDEPKKSK
ncbi:hypothetical protein LPJ64_004297 [Coemansia asiatica]|uniref:Uncharacterized protein n=1 Tax=Coemansia asiatica TaxID=1052880 RepID=A0A9W7XI65_9FUNG|nr:hypothetical protein LPJ64_004297 [Coemansia asiatica]